MRVKCPKCFEVNNEGAPRCVKCGAELPRIRIDGMTGQPPAKPAPSGGGGQPPMPQLRQGQTLANRYTVLSLVGRGGMGCIYRVQDNVLGEEVALKTLLPQFLKDKLVVERFFNEARIARKLSHPNVVRVHDIGQASNMVYISMEFLPGRSLRDMLEGMMPGQRMPIQQTLHIIDQLCAALEYAHKYTIHRDIKPENVMILPDGTVKLMDFGISKLMANTRMTGASVVMGTPFYMSPEQLRNSRDVDARADVFSVGVVLYETLTGNVPTGVPKPASHFQSDVPASLDAIITKCVDPEPRNRYQDATELRQALRPVMESINVTDSARPAAQPRSRGAFPARKVAGVALAALILAGTAGAVYVYDGRAPSTPSEAAAPTSSAPAASRYALYRAVAERARGRAQGAVSGSGLLEDALKEGDRLLGEAEGLSDRDTALKERYARQAMQHYVAVALRPRASGMTFVPGGMVEEDGTETWVAPFYIDEQEVSRGEFAAFCSSVSGGWRADFATVSDEEGVLPVTNVRFYDALAFAASKGRGIPTDLEWARAAYGGAESSRLYPWGTEWRAEACYCEEQAPAPVSEYREDTTWVGARNMLGNVAEWTSTPEDGGDAVDFGVPMRVRGGWYGAGESVLAERATMLYERYSALLGFRCVLRAPADPVEAARLLDGAS